MAFDANGYKQAALQAGIPQDVIEKTIADRSGVKGWLTEGRQGLGGVATAAGNILNLPSYAMGGALNQLSDGGSQPLKFGNPVMGFAQSVGKNGLGNTLGNIAQVPGKIIAGNIQGVMDKQSMLENLPKSVGIDPNSKVGLAVGLGGELLTPELPVTKLAKFGNVFSKGAKASNIFSKAGGILPDAGRTLLEKSYKLSASDIDKIARSIGVTDESEKAVKVIDYLEGLGLSGANRSSLKKLGSVIDENQEAFNSMVRTDTPIARKMYAQSLLDQAKDLERTADTPQVRQLVVKLKDEAERQLAFDKQKVGMTDTFLRDTTSRAFNEASAESINNPLSSSFSEQIGRAGVATLDKFAPGSAELGTKLRGLREAQKTLGRKSNTGLGTQLINSIKPGAAGFGLGAVAGYSSGNDPFTTGVAGIAGSTVLNNPRTLNAMGKILSNGVSAPALPQLGMGISKLSPVVNTLPQKAFRLENQRSRAEEEQRTPTEQYQLQESRKPKLKSPLVETGVSKKADTSYKRNVFKDAISRRMGFSY